MSKLNWLILAVQVADMAFTVKNSGFMVEMADNMNKKFRYLRNQLEEIAESMTAKATNQLSNTRLQSGLLDINQAQTYDPRFTDEEGQG